MEIVSILIQAGGEVNSQAGKYAYLVRVLSGCTPLHLASENGHVEVVNILIQGGGDVNKKTGDGWTPFHLETWTPLHLATHNGHVEVITALIAAGADKTIKNKHGRTPHDVAENQATRNALK